MWLGTHPAQETYWCSQATGQRGQCCLVTEGSWPVTHTAALPTDQSARWPKAQRALREGRWPWPGGRPWGPSLAYPPRPAPPTHVAVVNVEDVHFGRRLDFFHSGPVPAMALWAELKGHAPEVSMAGKEQGCSLPRAQRATHGCHRVQFSDSTKAQPWDTVVTI